MRVSVMIVVVVASYKGCYVNIYFNAMKVDNTLMGDKKIIIMMQINHFLKTNKSYSHVTHHHLLTHSQLQVNQLCTYRDNRR